MSGQCLTNTVMNEEVPCNELETITLIRICFKVMYVFSLEKVEIISWHTKYAGVAKHCLQMDILLKPTSNGPRLLG